MKRPQRILCVFSRPLRMYGCSFCQSKPCVLVDRGYYTFFHLSRQAQLAFAPRAKKHIQKLINGGVPVIIHGIKLSPGTAMETVVIIGGGASGMMAALTRRAAIGALSSLKGSSASGASSLPRATAAAISPIPARPLKTTTGSFPASPFLRLRPSRRRTRFDFFHSLGLITVTEHGGRVYPLSNSANSVVDVLRFALERAGVEVMCSTSARELIRGGAATVRTDSGSIDADYLIVACGGAAGRSSAALWTGMSFLKPLGAQAHAPLPRPCPAHCGGRISPRAQGRAGGRGAVARLRGRGHCPRRGGASVHRNGRLRPAAF